MELAQCSLSGQFYTVDTLLIQGLYHKDEGHKDKDWQLKCEWQIFQKGSYKITDPFSNVLHRLRNERHNGDRECLEQIVKAKTQTIESVKANMSIIVEDKK